MQYAKPLVTIELDEYNLLLEEYAKSKKEVKDEELSSEVLAAILNAMQFGMLSPSQAIDAVRKQGMVVDVNTRSLNETGRVRPDEIRVYKK